MADAFYGLASAEAVINPNQPIFSRDYISEFYSRFWPHINFSWNPDTLIMAQGGGLGYTFGRFTHLYLDSLGVEQTTSGIFQTI